MAEGLDYDDTFQYDEFLFDDEEDLVRDLVNIGIYGEQTTLDGMLEEAQKSIDASKDRVQKLNLLFGNEQNTG
jgi:hypothetical protein